MNQVQVQVCMQCGARIEIEDMDDREPIIEGINLEEERRHDVFICENCIAEGRHS